MTEHTIEIVQLGLGFDIDGYIYVDEVTLAYSAEAGLFAVPGTTEPDDDQLKHAVAELIRRQIWPLPQPGEPAAEVMEPAGGTSE